jgi:hypothetical protein
MNGAEFSLKLDREVENHSEETSKNHSEETSKNHSEGTEFEFPLMWLEE